MDLLHLLRGSKADNMDFFAHEFHHALRQKSKEYKVYAPANDRFDPVIQALNKIPLEGVASLLDKSKYFEPHYYQDTLKSTTQLATVKECLKNESFGAKSLIFFDNDTMQSKLVHRPTLL